MHQIQFPHDHTTWTLELGAEASLSPTLKALPSATAHTLRAWDFSSHPACPCHCAFALVQILIWNSFSLSTPQNPIHTPSLHYSLLYSFNAAAAAKSLQSCPTLCDPIDSSPPGSIVPGILQARTLEWVAISFSNA